MSTLPRFNYFFDLPGELREQILGYLVVKPGGIVIGEQGEWSQNIAHELGQAQQPSRRREKPVGSLSSWAYPSSSSSSSSSEDDYDDYESDDDDDHQTTRKSKWPLNYFLVSQTFHREVTAVYFSENTFYLLATGRKLAAQESVRPYGFGSSAGMSFIMNDERNRRRPEGGRRGHNNKGGGGGGGAGNVIFPGPCEELLGKTRYRDARRRMRNVVVYVRALRGPLVEGVLTPLGDMVLAGGLKHLEIRVWWFQAKGSGMLASVPMQAMYRVLRDPDLESAKLKVVAGAHEKAWCSFHARHGNSTMSLPCDGELGGRLGRGRECVVGPPEAGRAEWVEIDLEGLIGEYGKAEEALRILKVGD